MAELGQKQEAFRLCRRAFEQAPRRNVLTFPLVVVAASFLLHEDKFTDAEQILLKWRDWARHTRITSRVHGEASVSLNGPCSAPECRVPGFTNLEVEHLVRLLVFDSVAKTSRERVSRAQEILTGSKDVMTEEAYIRFQHSLSTYRGNNTDGSHDTQGASNSYEGHMPAAPSLLAHLTVQLPQTPQEIRAVLSFWWRRIWRVSKQYRAVSVSLMIALVLLLMSRSRQAKRTMQFLISQRVFEGLRRSLVQGSILL